MADETKIQWCDSTVNPIMGCAGCELFPTPTRVLEAIDRAIQSVEPRWKMAEAKQRFGALIKSAWAAAPNRERFKKTVTTTHIHHFRGEFLEEVLRDFGPEAKAAGEKEIAQQITCYAATLHMNKGLDLRKPDHEPHIGHAPTFETLTEFRGRVRDMAGKKDLFGKTDPDRPWIDGLPRLIFVSDMGDAFSRHRDFPFLKQEVIEPIQSHAGQRHLWLWLTKRPELMARFSEEVGGFPPNVCAMTTLTGADEHSLERLEWLKKVRSHSRGLSIEPLWERLPADKLNLDGVDWVILGGESGSTINFSRPFALEWVQELQAHCETNGVAFFLKQLGRRPTLDGRDIRLSNAHGGDWNEWPEMVPRVRDFPRQFHDYRAGESAQEGLRRQKQGGLTPGEAKRFKELDKQVAKFAEKIVDVANALLEIREDRLYRAKYGTFHDYCESVHQISRQYANRLIKAGQVRAEMVPIVSKMGLRLPENEGQLRELARLPDTEQRVEVIREVMAANNSEDGYTASQIREVVDARIASTKGTEVKPPSPTQRIRLATDILDRIEEAVKIDGDIHSLLAELRTVLIDPTGSDR